MTEIHTNTTNDPIIIPKPELTVTVKSCHPALPMQIRIVQQFHVSSARSAQAIAQYYGSFPLTEYITVRPYDERQ